MLNKVETPQKYGIFRQKTIGRRLIRPDSNPSGKPASLSLLSQSNLEEVRYQLKNVFDCFSEMLSGPLAANGNIIVNRHAFKHIYKCLMAVDNHLEFLNGPDGKEASNDTI